MTGSRRTLQRLRAALDGDPDGAVAPAARDDKQGRFSEGDAVGFVDEEMVAWGITRGDAAGRAGGARRKVARS